MAVKGGAQTGTRQCSISSSGASSSLDRIEFSDLKSLDIVGIYQTMPRPRAWRDAAQRSVDDAHMRYFIVHLHRCSIRRRKAALRLGVRHRKTSGFSP
jgi:hypothetical protein